MHPEERDRELIFNILEDAETLKQRREFFGVTEDSFVNDASFEGSIAYDSLLIPVYTIVEDALHLSDRLMDDLPDYPWHEVRSFRNIVAHGYRRVDSLLIPVYTIVEDALHLSDRLMDDLPDYPWHEVRSFRNIVAHGYRRVSKRIAWHVVSEDIPKLVDLLRQYNHDHDWGDGSR